MLLPGCPGIAGNAADAACGSEEIDSRAPEGGVIFNGGESVRNPYKPPNLKKNTIDERKETQQSVFSQVQGSICRWTEVQRGFLGSGCSPVETCGKEAKGASVSS